MMKVSDYMNGEQRKRHIQGLDSEMKELIEIQSNTSNQVEKDRLEKRIRQLFDQKLLLETR